MEHNFNVSMMLSLPCSNSLFCTFSTFLLSPHQFCLNIRATHQFAHSKLLLYPLNLQSLKFEEPPVKIRELSRDEGLPSHVCSSRKSHGKQFAFLLDALLGKCQALRSLSGNAMVSKLLCCLKHGCNIY